VWAEHIKADFVLMRRQRIVTPEQWQRFLTVTGQAGELRRVRVHLRAELHMVGTTPTRGLPPSPSRMNAD
jgi:hypothetical protein